MSLSSDAIASERVTQRRVARRQFLPRTIAFLLMAIAVVGAAPSLVASSGRTQTRLRFALSNCGYDPNGATDELASHNLNMLKRTKRSERGNLLGLSSAAGNRVEDTEDTALAEDDGTIVVSPTKFNLKNSSLLFTPEGEGYRVSPGAVDFNGDFGTRLGYFFGADNKLGDGDNGYRDVPLQGASFPFFGVSYDTIYIGTNGYITFTRGDTTARISPAALASELPRIAPLWGDLEVVTAGDIYYNRLYDGHLVTWAGAGQPAYGGVSTFQAVLYDDGRIVFAYRKVKAHAALVGLSPGGSELEPQPVDFSDPPSEKVSGAFFETFGKQKRIDLPALLRSFYRTHPDTFDAVYVWTDFDYDNGLGIAHSFNIRNDISGIGLKSFDRGSAYGSPERLSTIITMGNEADWPSDPQAHAAGLNSAISIVCHEQGHRWLAYVRFDADHFVSDDLLGRESAHWSFLVDTRTNTEGTFSSLMEGNAWRDGGAGIFTTIESAVNYFTPLDQYLMGLRSADEVGEIHYLVTDAQLTDFLREKSPFSGYSVSAGRKTISLTQIISREGPRIPDAADAPKELRVAFILLTQRGSMPSSATLEKLSRYRNSLVRYFSLSTERRASMDASLSQ